MNTVILGGRKMNKVGLGITITNKGKMWHIFHGTKTVGFAATFKVAKAKALMLERQLNA